jgi:photosynthetic reaction center H subunit
MADMDRIVPLDELDDFKVAEGDPDVRGWDVMSSDGRKIGEVDDLLVDTSAMKVRYLDVDVDRDLTEDDRDRHVLIPIGYARLDRDDKNVMVDSLNSSDVVGLPEYTHGGVTREYESDVRQRLDRGYTAGPENEDFYSGEAYDQNRFYGRGGEDERSVTASEEQLDVQRHTRESGAVEVNKEVETHHMSADVPKMREEVEIERRPITEGMSAEGKIGEGEEMRIPLHEEELDVQKRVVPREEVVVRKRQVEDTEHVEADLRRENVDVRREGDAEIRDERDRR